MFRPNGRAVVPASPRTSARDAVVEKLQANGLRPHEVARFAEDNYDTEHPLQHLLRDLEQAERHPDHSDLFDSPCAEISHRRRHGER